MTPTTPKPPQNLGTDGRRFWRTVTREYDVSPSELALLEQASHAYEHATSAWRTLADEGAVIQDRYGSPKQHPAVATANTFATLTARLAKQLGVELADDDSVKLKGRGAGRPTVTRVRKAA
jgi:P27 family predicted phage terminase small subunit